MIITTDSTVFSKPWTPGDDEMIHRGELAEVYGGRVLTAPYRAAGYDSLPCRPWSRGGMGRYGKSLSG